MRRSGRRTAWLAAAVLVAAPALTAGPARAAGAAASDLVATGAGDANGYHLYTASAAGGWAWRALTTLAPGGVGDDSWVGYQCVTGDGRYVIAVTAPRHVANDPAGRDHGASAFSVDALTGAVVPLASGVALMYFDPGCGAGHSVALSRYLGEGEARTNVLVADAASGRITSSASVSGEVVSSVPTATGVAGIEGDHVVDVGRDHVSVRATLPGRPYMLRPSAGGLDVLVAEGTTASLYGLSAGAARRYLTGSLFRLALYQGAGGRNVLIGASGSGVAGRFRTLTGPPDGVVRAASLRGSVALSDAPRVTPPGASGAAAWAARYVRAQTDARLSDASGRLVAARLPRVQLGRVVTTVPRRWPTAPGAHTATNTTTPVCSVARNDPTRQVPQPNATQVDWAIQQAVRGNLAGSVLTRPQSFLNMGLGAYSPSSDLPPIALSGHPGAPVPRSVAESVFAQESNWYQASFHALPGVSGNPLVADYYGAAGGLNQINYDAADCGYGVGQITTGMKTADAGPYSANAKAKIGVDYAENVAAGVRLLAATWNTLAANGILLNNGDPSSLENWYFATWAYNTGFHPPGSGPWGLGWTNNPQNSSYPPNRLPFLRTSYADASHPADWPYQERVVGWMETPLLNYQGHPSYGPPAYPSGSTHLGIPAFTAFCNTTDECSPSYRDAGGNHSLDYCTRIDRECWWHQPAAYAACPASCATSPFTVSAGATEPAPDSTYLPDCNSSLTPQATIVDEQPSDLNTRGCSSVNWSNAGTFTVQHGTDSSGVAVGAIDWHQLGAGFGGHTWFTHSRAAGDTAHTETGTWTPNLGGGGLYNVKVHVPVSGATTVFAGYTVYGGDGTSTTVTVDQNTGANSWISLGNFHLQPGAKLVLTNTTPETPGTKDIAYDAAAFTPVRGLDVHHTVDALAAFSPNQNLDTTLAATAGPLVSEQSIYTWAHGITAAVAAYPTCSGPVNARCVAANSLAAFRVWGTRVEAAGSAWHAAPPPDTEPQWLNFSNPTLSGPLTSATLADPSAYKIRSEVTVDFLVNGGQIDPSSLTVRGRAYAGDTHLPDFVRSIFTAYQKDYGIAPPNIAYSAPDLHQYTGAITTATPLATGVAPGREYKPYLEQPTVTDNGTCVRAKYISGGAIGLKPMVLTPSVRTAVSGWQAQVHGLVASGVAPAAIGAGADAVHDIFFQEPNLNPANTQAFDFNSPFFVAPPIWIEQDIKVCADGSVRPGDGTNVADSSYMPNLYLYLDNQSVGLQGQPTVGPAQTGDFNHFANPGSDAPYPLQKALGVQDTLKNPWDECDLNAGDAYYQNRRNGDPYPLRDIDPTDPQFVYSLDQDPAVVRFCDERYYPPIYYSDSNSS